MEEDTKQVLIFAIAITAVLISISFFVWDYNKTELIRFNEIDFGYKECIIECNMVSGNDGKTHLDEVKCQNDCYTFYYQDSNCEVDDE